MVACAVAALVLLGVLLCECGAGCAQCDGTPTRRGGGDEAAPRSPRSPPRTSRSFRSTRAPPSPRHRHTCAELSEAPPLPLPLPLPLTPNP